MKLQDQKTVEALEAQMPEVPEERKDKDCTCQPYHAPEVFLVGKAKRLVAQYRHGNDYDQGGQYYQLF